MKRVFFGGLLRAPVSIKDFGERWKWRWMANIGKALREMTLQKIKAGWLI